MRLTFLFVLLPLALRAADLPPLPLARTVRVATTEISTGAPPAGLAVRPVLGLLTVQALDGQVVHRTTSRILETRATLTPGGDYLLMFPEGDHYAKSKGEKMNTMLAYRSADKGRTWQGPKVAYDISYSQHGFIPFIPRGSQRLYAFGTQPMAGQWTWENGQRENAAIGYRWSDDDGHTWSDVKLIAPVNDPGFRGMSVMRMTETKSGTWLLGSHTADWSVKPFTTRQYLLRSEDRGTTWNLLPGARPGGWFAAGFDRMDEGRPLALESGKVLFMSRTPQGHLFTAWSEDDGKTWTPPAPSPLVHPDAPPMLFTLSDGKTLIAFHHHKVPRHGNGDLDDKAENMKVRSEIWFATSTDEGHTWSESRFLFANAVEANLKVTAFNNQCSYLDMFEQEGVLHLFLPHRWQQVLHLTIAESALASLPTEARLKELAAKPLKTVNLSQDSTRQVVIAQGTPEVYQGHPTTLLMPDGKTIFAVWTLGHGGTCGPMKRSDDGGKTWSELLPTPDNWRQTRNCPALYRLADPQGIARLFVFAGQGPDGLMQQAQSTDDGRTWSPMQSTGLKCIMPFCTIVPIEGGKKLLGLTNIRRPGETQDKTSNIIAQSESSDGGLTWAPWRIVLDLGAVKPCEPALVRSPDGRQLLCLLRENAKHEALYMTTDDEGRTWSEAKLLPSGLWGDRHMPHYAADGRLVVCFRDTGPKSPTRNHFIAWVGRYEDIIAGRSGEYRIKLLHSYRGGDCGYPGLELLPDGSFIATTYIKFHPGPELNSVVSTRFTLAETDNLVKAVP